MGEGGEVAGESLVSLGSLSGTRILTLHLRNRARVLIGDLCLLLFLHPAGAFIHNLYVRMRCNDSMLIRLYDEAHQIYHPSRYIFHLLDVLFYYYYSFSTVSRSRCTLQVAPTVENVTFTSPVMYKT